MKKIYLVPRQKVIDMSEEEMLCTSSGEIGTRRMEVILDDYDTYEDTPRSLTSGVDWSGTGTGSDF